MTTPTDYRAFLESFVAAEELILPSGPVSREHEGELQAVAKLFTRARAFLAAPEAVGVADEEILGEASNWLSYLHSHMGDHERWEGSSADLINFARAFLAHYGTAHPVPVPVASDWIPMPENKERAAGMALIGMAWLKDHAPEMLKEVPSVAPVPVGERLPGVGDCMANPRNGEGLWCWAWVQHDPSKFTGRWRMVRREWLADEATHWLPHWALPLPEAQP